MTEQMPLMPDIVPQLAERPERIGKTQVDYIAPRTILNKATGFLSGYDLTLNPYAGCSFGCTYCYAARFSGRRDAEDTWGQWVSIKQTSLELLGRMQDGALDGKRIYMSSVTDPYQPVERRVKLTRGLLEIMAERHAPKLLVQTRSPDVVRDIDLFHKIERRGGKVQVNMTVTTDDDELRRAFEPGCPSNAARLKGIAEAQAAGIQSCGTMTPLLLARDADAFADALLATGVRRFITQPFHTGRSEFVAGTRAAAITLMADRLGCSESEAVERHRAHYGRARRVLLRRLPHIGEGREGFAPPF